VSVPPAPRPPGPTPDTGPWVTATLSHDQRDPRDLLTGEQFTGVVNTVLGNNPGMAPGLAQRITAEALGFLAACAHDRQAPIAPSLVVDEGWHALILHTDLYARLCERLGGFIHHYPQLPDDTEHDPDTIARTVRLIELAGCTPDPELWAGPGEQPFAVAAKTWHTPTGPGGCGPIIVEKKPKPGGFTQ